MTPIEHDPQAVLSYGFDWDAGVNSAGISGWLNGEIITQSTWTITGPDSTLLQSDADFNDSKTKVTISGGTDLEDYILTNHIVTNLGYEDDRSYIVKVRQR